MKLLLSQIAAATGGMLFGSDREVSYIVTDSRDVSAPGGMFCAIRGERVDGHRFVKDVLAIPGCSALIDKQRFIGDGTVLVGDVTAAIAEIGEYYRRNVIPDTILIAVTGSVGKTTTKEMIFNAVLPRRAACSEGNKNSQVSAPLALTKASPDTEVFVSELGMSEKGEMAVLSKTVRPDICVITNIGTSHIEQLGSRENIRDEKLSVTAYMKKDGVLILNADDPMLRQVRLPFKTLTFSADGTQADMKALDIRCDERSTSFIADYRGEREMVTVNTVGKHNVLNALAALTAACCAGVSLYEAASSLFLYKPEGIRQNIYTVNGITVIADCYNASPESMNAALSVLASAKGRKVAVLGDMLELGTFAMGLHSSLGEKIKQCNTDVLLCYGDFAYTVCASFGKGMAFELEKREEFIDAVRAELRAGDTVLFKASNRLRFSELIDEVGLGKK